MDIKDIRNNGNRELHKMLQDKRNELRDLRFKSSARQLGNMKLISGVKKDIARILTLINQRNKIGAAKQA